MQAEAENDRGAEPQQQAHTAESRVPKKQRNLVSSLLRFLGTSFVALLAVALNMAVLGLLGAGVFVAVTLTDLPRTDSLRDVRLQEPLRVLSADGLLMAEFGVQRRSPVSFPEIPPMLVKAFLATEDARFFEHEGVDLFGLVRAAISYARTGRRTQGGSTITMQVARNFFLTREKTFQRKFAELLLSLHIERTLTKEEILELYLNKIFFGHRAYGVSAAAQLYYDKELEELSVAQMAMLAGIPKAPSSNNPVSNPKRAMSRRNYILGRMRELGYIDQTTFASSVAEPDDARLRRAAVDVEAGYVAEMVRREMVERFGEAAYQEGYRVTTTLDPRLQRTAQESVRNALLAYDRRHGYRGPEARHNAAELGDDETLDDLLASAKALPGLVAGIVLRADSRDAEVYLGGGRREVLTLKQVKWAQPFRDENSRGRAPRRVSDAVSAGDVIRLRSNNEGVLELSQRPSPAGACLLYTSDAADDSVLV